MKALLCALFLSFAVSTLAVANQPSLPAIKAIEIAQADLDSRGLQDKVHIYQMTYKKGSVMNGKAHWEVLWSDDFPAQTEGRNEIGLRISMDGNYKRAVK
ncbi:MAG: hypothetical protein P1U86_19290 [Verrucomicrobiales bacterium]|nr:hypothetical protein [Verrucomicrobiales bacterium]